jgi:hypothetical protein
VRRALVIVAALLVLAAWVALLAYLPGNQVIGT